MKIFILGFVACYIVCAVVVVILEQIDHFASEMFAPVYYIGAGLAIPFYFLYKMFLRFMFHPVTSEHFQEVVEEAHGQLTFKSVGRFRFCHDTSAKAFCNRWFICRLKRGE